MNLPVIGIDKAALLRSRSAWLRWRKDRSLFGVTEPKAYPCIAYEWIDGSESAYEGFLYPADVEAMSAALAKAEGLEEPNDATT